ncbi:MULTISPECIES: PfkB family carbohydrate kinase [Chitinophagaceae]
MSLISLGTMAFDELETPFGESGKVVGGSATYIAYAASILGNDIKQMSIVGNDFPQEELDELHRRGIATEGVEIVKDQKSFFWKGRYHLDMNTRDSLATELNVLENFNPVVPESYQGAEFLMMGNLHPLTQKSVIQQMKKKPQLIMLDTMNFWMDTAWNELMDVLKLVDVLVINDSEARQLSQEYSLVKAAKKILQMGPSTLIIKKGENGALLFSEGRIFFAPALPLDEVFDPTGAGDTFAGGFIGYLANTNDISFDNMKRAIIVGSALASFCCEKFGTERLKEVTIENLRARVKAFVQLVDFNIEIKE